MHVIAAKAVAFGEALQPEFKVYARHIVDNARVLAAKLLERGCDIVSGYRHTPDLADLPPQRCHRQTCGSKPEKAGITCNKNGIPFDPGETRCHVWCRLGTPACTTRGFGVAEFNYVGGLIADVLDGLAKIPKTMAKLNRLFDKKSRHYAKVFQYMR